MEQQAMRMVLVVRDPRDVVVSSAEYLYSHNRHPLHSHFTSMPKRDRIMASIRGIPGDQYNRLAGVDERIKSVLAWRHHDYTVVVRFEDLVGPAGGGSKEAQSAAIFQVAQHLGVSLSAVQADAIGDNLFGGTATFRQGAIGSWRRTFDEGHLKASETLLGELLVELGYEIHGD